MASPSHYFITMKSATVSSSPVIFSLILWTLFVVVLLEQASSFTLIPSLHGQRIISRNTELDALTPTGPFCPYRSDTTADMEPRMQKFNKLGPEFATRMARVQLELQMGNTPDKKELLKTAEDLYAAVEDWENLMARLRLSSDFQTREYAKLTEAHMDTRGVSTKSIVAMMKWQAGCMKAMALDTPPPFPPPELDLEKMMKLSEDSKKSPSVTGMMAAEAITSAPFTGKEDAFQSETVKQEYEALCRDHMALIKFGGQYETFDPLGKIRYLDEIEKIQERWDIFYGRFSLMGVLNKEYSKQCNAFLSTMGLDENEYRELLKKLTNACDKRLNANGTCQIDSGSIMQ